MKSSINNLKKMIFTAAVALFSISTAVYAQPLNDNQPVEVKYMGSVGSQPVFQVSFENPAEEEILVTLKDDEGNVLYSEKFNGKKFAKRFQLNHSQDDLKVTLSLTNRKDRQNQQFEINRNTRVVEDVTVTKVR